VTCEGAKDFWYRDRGVCRNEAHCGSFGQVCMRTVLDTEPFGNHKDSALIRTMVLEEFDCGEGEKAM
jgi:hypothetical protein